MTNTFTVEISEVNGEPMIDSRGMALLFGVSVEAVKALPFKDGPVPIPRMWVKRGRRRASEAKAHTGSTDMGDALQYWARKDHNAELELIYKENTTP